MAAKAATTHCLMVKAMAVVSLLLLLVSAAKAATTHCLLCVRVCVKKRMDTNQCGLGERETHDTIQYREVE